MSTLYMVATPIGNLQDITLRALDTLRAVDCVACEDTRKTGMLLKSFEIKKPLLSYHSHNMESSISRICTRLESGESVAYVTDAGTPGISDPGTALVKEARSRGIPVVPIPGVSAVTTLVSAAGIPGKSHFFEGFLSPKQGRRYKRVQQLAEMEENFVIYESPHRIVKLMDDLADIAPERDMCLGRELTKIHEELLSGTVSEVAEMIRSRDKQRGEFTLFISGKKKD